MKNIFIITAMFLTLTFCKGPGSGPLQKESFDKKDIPHGMEIKDHKGKVQTEKMNIVIDPGKNCTTVADLFANKESYAGKTIKVKGQVTKYNPGIMGKNWVHIQDGTEFEEEFDLTITTDIEVTVGETITLEGKITLDKDFGFGYFYNVLMEEGKPVKQ
jgi:hypothetical protein